MANDLNAIVVQNIEVSPGLGILRVVPDGWELPDFTPGQFAVLGLPGSASRCTICDPEDEARDPQKLIKRAYSIASSSVAKEFLELYIVLVPSGALTPRLFNLTAGDRVWLSPKFSGLFTLDEVPEDKHIVLQGTQEKRPGTDPRGEILVENACRSVRGKSPGKIYGEETQPSCSSGLCRRNRQSRLQAHGTCSCRIWALRDPVGNQKDATTRRRRSGRRPSALNIYNPADAGGYEGSHYG